MAALATRLIRWVRASDDIGNPYFVIWLTCITYLTFIEDLEGPGGGLGVCTVSW